MPARLRRLLLPPHNAFSPLRSCANKHADAVSAVSARHSGIVDYRTLAPAIDNDILDAHVDADDPASFKVRYRLRFG
jgi:hypothetical protein